MSTAADDLALCGLRLIASAEDCDCVTCRMLDRRFDVDLLATDDSGHPVLVAYRNQSTYGHSYDTITIRTTNDSGYADVQQRKLADGRSHADYYIQSYAAHVMSCAADDIRRALSDSCTGHPSYLDGRAGQTFRVLCPECVPAMAKHQRGAA